MNSDLKYEFIPAAFGQGGRLSTLNQTMNVVDRNLKERIMGAYDLAKNAGRDLNITFTANPKQLPAQ